jgi:hypothetical protein
MGRKCCKISLQEFLMRYLCQVFCSIELFSLDFDDFDVLRRIPWDLNFFNGLL